MKLRLAACSLCLAAVLLCARVGRAGEPGEPEGTGTVRATYPRLTSGVLAGAGLAELPEGVLSRVGDLEVQAGDVDAIVAGAPKAVQGQLQKNAFFLLDDLVARKLLLLGGKQAAAQRGEEVASWSERQILEDYVKRIAEGVQVTDAQVAEFYENNKDLCGGAALKDVKSDLTQYLLEEKRKEAVAARPLELAKTIPVVVSASWVKEQAPKAMDNPVDKARSTGKPTFVDFGAEGCRPCDMMVAVLKGLTEKYTDRLNVLFVHVGKEQVLAARFGISAIPVQVIFNAEGQEVYRHVGYLPQSEIEKELAKIGM